MSNIDVESRKLLSHQLPGFVAAPVAVLAVGVERDLATTVLGQFAPHGRVGRVKPFSLADEAATVRWGVDLCRLLNWSWPDAGTLPRGFYLFLDGRARTFQRAYATGDDHRSLLVGAGFALLGLHVTHPAAGLDEPSRLLICMPTLKRVFGSFLPAIEEHTRESRQHEDKLSEARVTLGVVSPFSGPHEIERRYAQLVAEWEPLRHDAEPTTRRVASEKLGAFAEAYELIIEHGRN